MNISYEPIGSSPVPSAARTRGRVTGTRRPPRGEGAAVLGDGHLPAAGAVAATGEVAWCPHVGGWCAGCVVVSRA
ncbi:hypothetical protein [Rhodococcus jostii]|uniref:hypothetical protein n=1 Tax=Rhodococcus jostii TaxID=132919 RepID=UPI0011D04A46|nr:hypothetical protein [Rhodococcus jostii]